MGGTRPTSRAGVFFILGLAFLPLGLAGQPAFVGIGAVMLVVGMTQILADRSGTDSGDE